MTAASTWMLNWFPGQPKLAGGISLLLFIVLLAVLVFCSLKLVKWAQVIIGKTKFGGGFVGGTLIATITSLPEMITEITQGAAGTPENGIGDDIGSNAFSVFLIAVGALLFTKYLFMNKLGRWTKISLGISMGLSLLLSLFLALNRFGIFPDVYMGNSAFMIGLIPLSFFAFYLFSIWLSHKYGDEDEEPIDVEFVKKHTVKEAIIKFIIASVALVGVAVMMNISASAMQQGLGMSTDSVGGIFLAMATSAPEVVAFFVFMKTQQPAAAIASLVGSHFFNIGISFFGDLAFTGNDATNGLDVSTFNTPEMGSHFPLAMMTFGMIFLLLVHTFFAQKFPQKFKKKGYYYIVPSIVVMGYILGWAAILVYN